jgi:hypothetical protein
MAWAAACGGWRKQWELRLQVIISRFILPVEQLCAKCDPLPFTFTYRPSLPMGKEVDLRFTHLLLLAPACSSALLLVGAPFWVLHRNFDKSVDNFIQDTNPVQISRNLGFSGRIAVRQQ